MVNGSFWDSVTWGHGEKLSEWFLEPTCPHCGRAFGKLKPLLARAGEDQLSVRLIIHSQPWHLFSGTASRAVLAASLLPDGRDAAWRVLAAIYQNREEFVATEHSHGPNMEVSLSSMLKRIERYAGVELRGAFESQSATTLLKMHTRYARQNGIHASPTVMVDGIVNETIGSRDEVESWLAALDLA
ncbi:DsbA family protein [Tropicimonas marinistellae]|uniref:DsbA family protein n=1 Tax=Tropicimonas marinistellae TaxID=1739787 RepID=UPI00082D8A3A|nr:thioredoxin domain-containing protein [Tropicimonas marinistellae]